MGGLDVGAVVHWIGQYEDDNIDLVGTQQTRRNNPEAADATLSNWSASTWRGGALARKITDWTTLDLILNYTFNYPAPAPAEVPGYAKDGGKNVKMKDGKEKNVVPVSTAEYGCQQLEMVA